MSFISGLFGSQSHVSLEDRTAALDFLVQLSALRALQDDEAARFNGVLAKHRGSLNPGGDGLRQVAMTARRMSEVNNGLEYRHRGLSPIPDVADSCHAAWWISWNLLQQWSSRTAAAYEGMYEGASPPSADIQQLLARHERARDAAVKEEAKLLKRLRVSFEEATQLIQDGERLAQSGEMTDGNAPPASIDLSPSRDRSLALNFLRAFQWATSRQQLAAEEWNDAGAIEISGPLGDEMYNAPGFELNEANAPRLLPVAERRLASAQLVSDEFAKLKSGRLPDSIASAIEAWARAFDMHLKRCAITVRNLQTLIAGTPAGGDDDADLVPDESLLIDRAVAAEHEIMEQCGISFVELQEMMITACNVLRFELGKPPLSAEEYRELYERSTTGQRPRFYA